MQNVNVILQILYIARVSYQGPHNFNFVIQCQVDYNKLLPSMLFIISLTRHGVFFVFAVPKGIFQKLDLIIAIYYFQHISGEPHLCKDKIYQIPRVYGAYNAF